MDPSSVAHAKANIQLILRKDGDSAFFFDANLIPITGVDVKSGVIIKARPVLNRYPVLQKIGHKPRIMTIKGTYRREKIGEYLREINAPQTRNTSLDRAILEAEGRISEIREVPELPMIYRGENIFSLLHNYMDNGNVLQVSAKNHNYGTWVITDIDDMQADFFESASQTVKWTVKLMYEAYGAKVI